MLKGVTGSAFEHWIKQVKPKVRELCKELDMPYRTFYDQYKRETVEWSFVARVHGILSNKYEYDITAFFPEFNEYGSHLVAERQAVYGGEALIKKLQQDLEKMREDNRVLMEKLNLAYERIVEGYFEKMNANLTINNELMKQLINTIVK